MAFVNKSVWHLLHHWNRQFISPRSSLKHNERLHNAQFINHTARTIAEHKHSLSALRLFSFHTKQYVQHVFSLCFSASSSSSRPTKTFPLYSLHPHDDASDLCLCVQIFRVCVIVGAVLFGVNSWGLEALDFEIAGNSFHYQSFIVARWWKFLLSGAFHVVWLFNGNSKQISSQ